MPTQATTKRVIAQTARGCVTSDERRATVQVEFGNLFLRFDLDGFEAFKRSIEAIDCQKSEAGNEKKPYRRKIFVALQPASVTMAFHREEIAELKRLLEGASFALVAKTLCAQAARHWLN